MSFFLLLNLATAAPLPIVPVRPLPASGPVALSAGFSKAQLISAMFTDTTVAYHPLQTVAITAGDWIATPATFTCSVVNQVLTVSYTREGFLTDHLPKIGSCDKNKDHIRFRIKVEPPGTGA